jgi:hypothetical protein
MATRRIRDDPPPWDADALPRDLRKELAHLEVANDEKDRQIADLEALVEEKWQAVETMKSNIATFEDEVEAILLGTPDPLEEDETWHDRVRSSALELVEERRMDGEPLEGAHHGISLDILRVLRLMQCEEQGVTPSESSVESDAEPEPDILSGMRGMLNAVQGIATAASPKAIASAALGNASSSPTSPKAITSPASPKSSPSPKASQQQHQPSRLSRLYDSRVNRWNTASDH